MLYIVFIYIQYTVFCTDAMYRHSKDGFVGMRVPDATRDGSKNIQAWRLDLIVKFLLLDGITTFLPADWTNYTREHWFELHHNPNKTFSDYKSWLTKHCNEQDPVIPDEPVSQSSFFDIVNDKHIRRKKSHMCSCPQCDELGDNTFKEMIPLLNDTILKIYDGLCANKIISEFEISQFKFRFFFEEHVRNLRPIESFWLSEGSFFFSNFPIVCLPFNILYCFVDRSLHAFSIKLQQYCVPLW